MRSHAKDPVGGNGNRFGDLHLGDCVRRLAARFWLLTITFGRECVAAAIVLGYVKCEVMSTI